MNDPGEGPSVPRYRLARSINSHRTRLSLVNDIEEIDSDSYIPSARPLSAGSNSIESTGLQWTPPASPSSRASHSRTHSFNSLNVPPHYISRRASSPDLREAEEDEEEEEEEEHDDRQIGQISIIRPAFGRSSSAHTASSNGALGMGSTRSSSAITLPIQIMDPAPLVPAVPSVVAGKAREHRPAPLETNLLSSSQPPMLRSLSAHTASSYAMYTPRSPQSAKQVRFSSMAPGDVPPLPPHAQDALAHARQQQEQQVRFFHGPPPLHGDDVLPPPYKGDTPGTDNDSVGSGDDEKDRYVGADGTPLPWWRRRGKLFWILVTTGIVLLLFGAVVGAVVGTKLRSTNKSNNAVVVSTNGTSSTFPPPTGFLGTWSFVTNLTSAETACSPAPANASEALWLCYPYQTPPSTESVTWSFIITDASNSTDSASTSDDIQLMIESTNNPFTLDFNVQDLNLTRTLTNAYYSFSYSYTKTTLVAFGSTVAECEFPNSIFSGQLYVNNSIFSTTSSLFATKNVQTDNRGNWPGNIVLQEEKIQGGLQILCRDKQTQNVLDLGDLTTAHGDGNCLCGYTNF